MAKYSDRDADKTYPQNKNKIENKLIFNLLMIYLIMSKIF